MPIQNTIIKWCTWAPVDQLRILDKSDQNEMKSEESFPKDGESAALQKSEIVFSLMLR